MIQSLLFGASTDSLFPSVSVLVNGQRVPCELFPVLTLQTFSRPLVLLAVARGLGGAVKLKVKKNANQANGSRGRKQALEVGEGRNAHGLGGRVGRGGNGNGKRQSRVARGGSGVCGVDDAQGNCGRGVGSGAHEFRQRSGFQGQAGDGAGKKVGGGQ